jgi:hypothetical protein
MPNEPNVSVVSGFRFRTPVQEWTSLRVVGFEVLRRVVPRGEWNVAGTGLDQWPQHPIQAPDLGIDYAGNAAAGIPPVTRSTGIGPMTAPGYAAYWRGSGPRILLKKLQVGGSACLFLQEGYVDGDLYLHNQAGFFPGLRAYPVIGPTDQLYVQVAISGPPLTGMSFSLAAVCDVLDDAQMGAHVPGPYARQEALMRQPSETGEGFVR